MADFWPVLSLSDWIGLSNWIYEWLAKFSLFWSRRMHVSSSFLSLPLLNLMSSIPTKKRHFGEELMVHLSDFRPPSKNSLQWNKQELLCKLSDWLCVSFSRAFPYLQEDSCVCVCVVINISDLNFQLTKSATILFVVGLLFLKSYKTLECSVMSMTDNEAEIIYPRHSHLWALFES